MPRLILPAAASGLLPLTLAAGCAVAPPMRVAPPAPPAHVSGTGFTDVTRAAGITHIHEKPVLDHQLDNIMSWVCSVGAAAAAADFDEDGRVDLYVTNSRKGRPNALYRNNGDGTFTDVAVRAGVADVNGDDGTSMDCVWGDYDNDGDPDLYLVRWGNDILFRNEGDGTFTDVTNASFRRRDGAPGTQWANGNAAVFLDFDLDGRLDLYVGNYFDEVDLWNLESTSIMHDDFEKARNGGENYLYHQQSDGTFVEMAASLGLNDPGWTLAVGAADVDNDGRPDLYCADDFGPDQLFLNKGDGTFTNVSARAIGVDTRKGMNVDFGDFNSDGWLDIYVTNITTAEYLQEGNMLWHNNGPDPDGTVSFTDIALEAGAYDGGWGWGAKFFDADNDADLDIIALNGFISAGEGNYWYDLASWTVVGDDPADSRNWPAIGDRSFSGYETFRFFRNDGWASFTERAREVGLDSDRDGRGVVCFDYDNDGDVDLFVANQGQPPALYRNDLPRTGHWLGVALAADPRTGVNRDAVGTRVTIVTDRGRQVRERDGGNGFSGQSEPRLHFGLGPADRVALLEVRWPDGGRQYVENVAADRVITIRQDPTRYVAEMALDVGAPQAWTTADDAPTRVVPAIAPEALERQLTELETRLRTRPASRVPAGLYRERCVTYDQHDRSIAFFRELYEADPNDHDAGLELSCAYIDKIPTCGGIAAIVSKGTLARKSLDILDVLLDARPDWWLARYCRGLNHLHWPRALRHSDDAVRDLTDCLELQRRDSVGPKPWHVRTHVALGDALAKDGLYEHARVAWHVGLAAFPESPALRDRLAIEDDRALAKFIADARGLEDAIDTDLTFIERN